MGRTIKRRADSYHKLSKSEASETWFIPIEDLVRSLKTTVNGLSSAEAKSRKNPRDQKPKILENIGLAFGLFIKEARNPLLAILFFAAIASGFSKDWQESIIVITIITISIALSFYREYRATLDLKNIKKLLNVNVRTLRDGLTVNIPLDDIVPGDVVLLEPGTIVPGDGLLIESNNLLVDESPITGESFPVEKFFVTYALEDKKFQDKQHRQVFLGTNICSGYGKAIIVKVGKDTQYGTITKKSEEISEPSDFDLAVYNLGFQLLKVMLIMVTIVYFLSIFFERATTDFLMFAIALAVGLSPELLPAIVTIHLAKSASNLAKKGVLVRHLKAIQNLGSIDVLCTDKTGTITEGKITFESAWSPENLSTSEVLEIAQINAYFQSGQINPIDLALTNTQKSIIAKNYKKIGEVPYDFTRKRTSIIAQGVNSSLAILTTKGAFEEVLNLCTMTTGDKTLDNESRKLFLNKYMDYSRQGLRVLAVAIKHVSVKKLYSIDDEAGLKFLGLITFLDKPKVGVKNIIQEMRELGVAVKLITGDNRFVAASIAQAVGIKATANAVGCDLEKCPDEALYQLVKSNDVFSEVNPHQKARIVHALKRQRHIIGYLGDGINDVPAMRAADVSISVQTAADITKSTASLVLLQNDLKVIIQGIRLGRQNFANTLKYILLTSSSNLGNMISMAIASFFLPYLPLSAGQILLNNLLSDLPAFGLANDDVDEDQLKNPQRWDTMLIWRYMLQFGLLSAVFDFFMLFLLLVRYPKNPSVFHTAWFIESLLTEVVIIFSIRTRFIFYQSRPSYSLVFVAIFVAIIGATIPFTKLSDQFGFVPLPLDLFFIVIIIVLIYFIATELLKQNFYSHFREAKFK